MRRRAISPGRHAPVLVGLAAGLAAAAAIGLMAGSGLLAGSSGGHLAGNGGTARGAAPGPAPASHRAGDGKGQSGRATASGPRVVTISAVGDMMLGNTPDLPPDPGVYLDAVRPILDNGAQIVFGNLEGTRTTATVSKCGPSRRGKQDCFAFRDPPAYARYFRQAGFTVLNDANNHSFDFGAAGQAQTVRAIHAAGLAQTGLPGEITLVKAHGTRVAWVAFAPYDYDASLLDMVDARALIERAAGEARVVVVYMHAGAEGVGADQVTGREEYYLGDLDLSAVLHVTLSSAGRFERARIYPIQFTTQGQPVPGGGAVPFIARLSAQDFGRSAARILPSGAVRAP